MAPAIVIGTITPAQLTLKITGAISKVYDGLTATNGTTAQLTAANFAVLSGLQANDGVTVNSTAEITNNTVFNSQNVLGAGALLPRPSRALVANVVLVIAGAVAGFFPAWTAAA